MTAFDLAVVAILGIAVIISIFKGLIREIFSLLGYVAGYLLAIKYQQTLVQYLSDTITNPSIAAVISFIVIFLVTIVAISMVGRLLRKIVHSTVGPGIDRVLGGGIGVIKGVIILVILIFPLQYFPELENRIKRDSKFAPHLESAAGILKDIVNAPTVKKHLTPIKKVQDKLDQFTKRDGNQLNQVLTEREFGALGAQQKPLDQYTPEERAKLMAILSDLEKKDRSR